MTTRYIGSKARLAETIMDIVGLPENNGGVFVDAFCGTGVVSRTASMRGWNVYANDILLSATMLTEASLLCEKDLNFSSIGSYHDAIELLNRCEPFEGFIWKTYSPASLRFCDYERRYFTESNAKHIDGARKQISEWLSSGVIGQTESNVLIADLIEASNSVANIAGTYGCFLKKWTSQSSGHLKIKPRTLLDVSTHRTIRVGDVFTLSSQPNDIAYLDPPYTKRQYGSYYHIPETIAHNDHPEVDGVAGLRPWKHIASPFCYKTKALNALCECIRELGANRVFLSYSSQGHVAMDSLLAGLSAVGLVEVFDLGEIGRYRPNQAASAGGSAVEEYLIKIDKGRKG